MLIAYDLAGNVVATLDYAVAKDANGSVIGLIDFEAHELAGGQLLDIWSVPGAAGSGTWPEWIGGRAHDFRVLRGPDGRIATLQHKNSGFRRNRASVIADIAAVLPNADGTRDLRPVVGGPARPLRLDDNGQTITDPLPPPPALPLIGLS